MYTFDSDTVSDLHKDARGWRPREDFWGMWKKADDARKQRIWDGLLEELKISMEEDKIREQYALDDFEHKLKLTMSTHKIDQETALRWMIQPYRVENSQDIEHWVWEYGILFTDRGREVVEILKKILGK